ncbi:MAG: Rrf2 family transcriptional regulator [Clostridiales Family XIII bacterium]|jgi:Rrf2 family protein|nr:Rrf2 family transcriptional regulator [Clostridiales Family XIII bacterium]
MRISVKGRYALAAAVLVAEKQTSGANVTVGSVSEELGLSKIYLEQVFAQLKKVGILTSAKGPKGGYQFARPASVITAWEVLSALETGFAERAEETVTDNDPGLEMALKEKVYERLDASLQNALTAVTVQDILEATQKQRGDQSFMMGL